MWCGSERDLPAQVEELAGNQKKKVISSGMREKLTLIKIDSVGRVV